MTTDSWVSFWKSHGQSSTGLDPQSRVCRTSNKKPVDEATWEQTLAYVRGHLQVGRGAHVLDLCAGNGLFSRAFAADGAEVTAVDVSPDLLAELDALGLPAVRTRCQDMRELDFAEGSFSHVFLYAGVQYLTHAETVRLLRAAFGWLRPGGVLMLGDVPDGQLRWAFYNTPERRRLFFDNLLQDKDVIGTWFDRAWILHLAEDAGFSEAQTLDQPSEQIYAHFRFDALMSR